MPKVASWESDQASDCALAGNRARRLRRLRAESKSCRAAASMIRIVSALPSSLVRRFCGVARGRLAARMHRGEERYDRVDLRGTQVLAVGRHISAALDNLPHHLAPRKANRSVVERGAAQTALIAERMTIAALLALNQKSALQLERRATLDVIDRGRRTAPRLHHRRPRREGAEPGQCSDQCKGKDNDHDRDWTPSPALFAGSRDEGQGEQYPDADERTDQHQKCF